MMSTSESKSTPTSATPTPTRSQIRTQSAWLVVRQGTPRTALAFRTDVKVVSPPSSKSISNPKTKPKPKPEPKRGDGDGDVVVKVKAAALNPVGWKLMRAIPTLMTRWNVHPSEHDFAGVIVQGNASGLREGEEVLGWVPVPLQFRIRQGALSQYVTLPAANVVRKPQTLSWEEAAGMSLAGLTALQGLRLGGYDLTQFVREHSIAQTPTPTPTQRTPPEWVFINGGSTAVGIYAIQIATSLGLRVVASASARNEAFVRELGADVFVDYTSVSLPSYLASLVSSPSQPPSPSSPESESESESGSGSQPVTLGTPFGMIFDAVGLSDMSLYQQSEAYLKEGGTFVTTGMWPDEKGVVRMVGRAVGTLARPAWLGGVKRSWRLVSVVNDQEDLKALCWLVDKGSLRPRVDSTYEFADALDAYDRLLTGRATGKVVVRVDSGSE